MKARAGFFRYGVLGLGLLGVLQTVAAQSEQARLERVELYRGSGEAVRTVRLAPVEPVEEVVLDRLPGDLAAERIRVSVKSGSVDLAGLQFKRLGEAEQEPGAATEEATRKVRELERRLESLRARVDNLEAQVSFAEDLLASLLEGFEEGNAELLEERARVVFEEKQEAERQLRGERRTVEEREEKLERLLQKAVEERDSAQRADAALRGRLVIRFAEPVSEAAELEVRHPLRRVGWQPAYRVEAQPGEARMILEYGARIRNQTGEPWEAVEVVLLTGAPGWRAEAPEAPVVVLREPRPVEPMRARAEEGRVMAMAAAQTAESPAVQEERLATRFRLRLREPVTTEPFARDVAVELDRWAWTAVFWSETTPLVAETAYLHGEVELTDLRWPLLAGPAVLLVDGAVTGRRQMEFTNPGASLSLGFGENPGIEVTYRELKKEQGDAGLVNRKRVYERHYRTELVNRMPVPHEVRVNERFPVSQDEDIEVRRYEPEDVEVDPETGRFTVSRQLASEESAEVDIRYEVRSPEDWRLPERF